MKTGLLLISSLMILVACDSQTKKDIKNRINNNDVTGVIKIVEEQILIPKTSGNDEANRNLLALAVDFVSKNKSINQFKSVIDHYMVNPTSYNEESMSRLALLLANNGFYDYSLMKKLYFASKIDKNSSKALEPIVKNIKIEDLLKDMKEQSENFKIKAMKGENFQDIVDNYALISNLASSVNNGGAIYQEFDQIVIQIAKALPAESVYGITVDNRNEYNGFIQKVGLNFGVSRQILILMDELNTIARNIENKKSEYDDAVKRLHNITSGKRDQTIREIAAYSQQLGNMFYASAPRELDEAKE